MSATVWFSCILDLDNAYSARDMFTLCANVGPASAAPVLKGSARTVARRVDASERLFIRRFHRLSFFREHTVKTQKKGNGSSESWRISNEYTEIEAFSRLLRRLRWACVHAFGRTLVAVPAMRVAAGVGFTIVKHRVPELFRSGYTV